jgi:hypothetical protein
MMTRCSSPLLGGGRSGDHGGGRGCFVKKGTVGVILEVDTPSQFLVSWSGGGQCFVCENDKWEFADKKKKITRKPKKKTRLTLSGVACKKCGIKPLTNPESIEAKLCQNCIDEDDDDLGL